MKEGIHGIKDIANSIVVGGRGGGVGGEEGSGEEVERPFCLDLDSVVKL
jgi:hypothetical protein